MPWHLSELLGCFIEYLSGPSVNRITDHGLRTFALATLPCIADLLCAMRRRRPRKAKKIEAVGSDSENQKDSEFKTSESDSAASEFESAPRKRSRLPGARKLRTRKETSGKRRKKDATSKQLPDEGGSPKNAGLEEALPLSEDEVWTEVAIDHNVPLEDTLSSSENEDGFEISLER